MSVTAVRNLLIVDCSVTFELELVNISSCCSEMWFLRRFLFFFIFCFQVLHCYLILIWRRSCVQILMSKGRTGLGEPPVWWNRSPVPPTELASLTPPTPPLPFFPVLDLAWFVFFTPPKFLELRSLATVYVLNLIKSALFSKQWRIVRVFYQTGRGGGESHQEKVVFFPWFAILVNFCPF